MKTKKIPVIIEDYFFVHSSLKDGRIRYLLDQTTQREMSTVRIMDHQKQCFYDVKVVRMAEHSYDVYGWKRVSTKPKKTKV